MMLYRFFGCIFVCVIWLSTPLDAQEAPVFKTEEQTLDAGYIQLQWQGKDGSEYILQESATPDFEKSQILYQGTDTKLFISGKKNGDFYYRIKTVDSDWTAPLKLTVKHHSQQKALWFLVIGFVVFLTTLMAILWGAKKRKT